MYAIVGIPVAAGSTSGVMSRRTTALTARHIHTTATTARPTLAGTTHTMAGTVMAARASRSVSAVSASALAAAGATGAAGNLNTLATPSLDAELDGLQACSILVFLRRIG